MRIVTACAVVAALWANAAGAQFTAPTVCAGQLDFYNEDGSFETYVLTMDFDGDAYTIRAVNPARDEATEDSGRCGTYLTSGCRHSFPPAEGGEAGYFDFALEHRGEERYFYSETWSDGFSGSTMLECRTSAGRP